MIARLLNPAVKVGSEYLEGLWFLMQHSDDPDKACVVFDCYVDDSGTHEQSDIVVLGGIVLDRASFIRFNDKWRPMLRRYCIDTLHMTDFVRPYGKHIGMYQELKIALFTEAVAIINACKLFSISVKVSHAPYRDSVPIEIYREHVAPYTSAFIYLARFNAVHADHNNYPDRITYLVDETRNFAEQIRNAHVLVKAWENSHGTGVVRTGALAFDSDDNVSALQAADLVAWAARRKLSGDDLVNEFVPLKEVLRERFLESGARALHSHFYGEIKDDLGPKMMADVKAKGPQRLNEALESLRKLAESESSSEKK